MQNIKITILVYYCVYIYTQISSTFLNVLQKQHFFSGSLTCGMCAMKVAAHQPRLVHCCKGLAKTDAKMRYVAQKSREPLEGIKSYSPEEGTIAREI